MSDIDDLIRKKLENLRGGGASSSLPQASTSGVLPKTVKKTCTEQVEDLLSQLVEESAIDKKVEKANVDIEAHLMSRLVRLKSREGCEFFSSRKTPDKPQESPDDDLYDEEFFRRSSCTDLLADLDRTSDASLSDDSNISECLCVICDEKKPSVICLGCDKDCYCNKCFKEYHCDGENHKTEPYSKKV